MLQRFFWLIEGELAGSSCPGMSRPGPYGGAPGLDELSADLAWLQGQGIAAVLTLTEAAAAGSSAEPARPRGAARTRA
jgi:hypothetical protein